MASQIKGDENVVVPETENSNVSYAGVLTNLKTGELNTSSAQTSKDNKETPVKIPKESKETPSKILKETRNAPKPSLKPAVATSKTKTMPADSPVQEKDKNGPLTNDTHSGPSPTNDSSENRNEESDDDFCKVTTRKSKEKRNNGEKHSMIPESRHSRIKKIRRSDSITNDSWRNHKPVNIDENTENKDVNQEKKFVEAPIPKVNPWVSNKAPAVAPTIIESAVETREVEEKVVPRKQPVIVPMNPTISGKLLYKSFFRSIMFVYYLVILSL